MCLLLCGHPRRKKIRGYGKLWRLPHWLHSVVVSGGDNLLLAMPSVSLAGGWRVPGRSIGTWLPGVATSLHVHPCLPLPRLPHFGWCAAAEMDLSLPRLIGWHISGAVIVSAHSNATDLQDDQYAASLMDLFFHVSWTATGNSVFLSTNCTFALASSASGSCTVVL